MALVYIEDSDPWFTEYDACEKLFREIMEQLTERNNHLTTSQSCASLSANIRIRLKQYNREVQQLKSKIDVALKSKAITVEEAERRTRQIEILESRNVQLQNLYHTRSNSFASFRADLLTSSASAFADGGTTSWTADDDDNNDDDAAAYKPIDTQVSISDLKTYQDRVLQEQDKNLEELCVVIARQKEIGQTISNEVDHQHEIIDNLVNHMDRTDESLINRTRQVQTISFKDRTCGYWIVIILLFVCIITVVVI